MIKAFRLFMMTLIMGLGDLLDRLRKNIMPPQALFLEFSIGQIAGHKLVSLAAELKIADILKDQPKSIAEIAQATGADPDTLLRVMRTLTSIGVFRARKDGRFETNRLGKYLESDREGSMHAFVRLVGRDFIADIWSDMPTVVRTGKDYYQIKHGTNLFDWLQKSEQDLKLFDVAMTSISAISNIPVTKAYDFSGFKSIVDIGGGYGSQLAAILKSHPELRGVLFDLPDTIRAVSVSGYFQQEGLNDRIDFIPGSFFDAIPSGHDVYFLKNILHDWSRDRATQILSNCRNAVRNDSTLLAVENILLDDYNEPDLNKFLDINLLALMGGRAYTKKEFIEVFKNAGFRIKHFLPTESPFVLIEAVPIV